MARETISSCSITAGGDLTLTREQIALVCDRHRGVGADGVLVLEQPTNGADFRMRYYNADGGEAEMCGNGARCFARFANRTAGPLEKLSFETPAGVIGAQLTGELVTLQMSEPNDLRLGLEVPLERRNDPRQLCRQRRPACRGAGGEN